MTHSTTKYMDGHALQVGGAIVDSGNFDWTRYPDKFPGLCTPDESYHGVTYTERFGLGGAYITKATVQLMRDLGSIPSPQNCFLLNIGLETLPLRMAKHCANAQAVAEYLEKHPKVAWVNYAGLPGNKYYERARKYLPKRQLRRGLLRGQGRPERSGDLHGRSEAGLHRHSRGRCQDLRPPPRLLHPPPDERRGAGRGWGSP